MKYFILLLLAAGNIGQLIGQNPNTASYPNPATDNTLFVASNLAQAVVGATIGTGDTVLTVGSTAPFLVPTIITIDSEYIAVCSKGATTFTICSGGRGFDGSTASNHNVGTIVYGYINRYFFNQLAAEVKAIEASANNITSQATDYKFSQTPGGTLTAGISNTITLSPVPLGVNGTDPHHRVYLSAGTGTAEWMLITGGSAISGAATGTIIGVPAFNHSGAWTISSPSGVQEAIVNNRVVSIQSGTLNVCDLFITQSTRLVGSGMNSTNLNCQVANLPTLTVYAIFTNLSDFTVSHTGVTPVVGGDGIVTAGGEVSDLVNIQRVQAVNNYHGFLLSTVNEGVVKDCFTSYNVSDGYAFDPTTPFALQWDLYNNESSNNGGAGYNVTNTSGASVAGPRFHGDYTYSNNSYGIIIQAIAGSSINGILIENGFYGSDNNDEILLDTHGTQNQVIGPNLETAGFPGGNVGYPQTPVVASHIGAGLHITANNFVSQPITVVGVMSHANSDSGIIAQGPGTIISGGNFSANGFAHIAGDSHRAGITIQAGMVQVTGSFFSDAGGPNQLYGIEVSGTLTPSEIVLGPNVFDSSLSAPIKYTTVPTSMGPHIPAIQAATNTGCTTAASAGAVCTTVITWPKAFPGTNYIPTCSGIGIASGVPVSSTVTATSTTTTTVQTVAITAAAAQSTLVGCVGVYN